MKKLSRSQYLHLTGTPVEMFKSLMKRRQIPFFGIDNPYEVEGHRPYLAIEAVLLILANDLSFRGGLDRDKSNTSLLIAANNDSESFVSSIKRAEAGEEIWLGIFEYHGCTGARLPLISAGTRQELMAFVDHYWFEDETPLKDYAARIIMTNISRAVREVHMLAPTIGVEMSSIVSD